MTYVDRLTAPFSVPVSETAEDERALIRRAQERDTGAFESLYHGHVRRVYAVCLRMTANVTQAEELTQKTFITLWEKIRLFRGESAFSSWLHRVAVNTVLSEIRADQRRTQRVFATEDPADFETPAPAPSPGTRLDLEAAVAALPPQARMVFVLHDVEGWQHNEIAEQLGVATGTSKAQLHRARKLLQEALR
jgi:RNA polymerase sigma-70 factor (ECF subfamily)